MEDLPMRLYVSLKYFVIHWRSKHSFLVMERNTHRIYSTDSFSFSDKGIDPNSIFYIDIYFLLGVVPIESVTHIAVVTRADLRGELSSHKVYEIKDTELIEFTRPEGLANLEKPKQNIRKLLSSGFYFSYTYHLTEKAAKLGCSANLHETSDERFYWNLKLYSEFISQNLDSQWFVPLVQGYFGTASFANCTLALISRRSCERTGTRYNCRGVDQEGNVANFVETEQVLVIGSTVFSYLQIRGSVPLYWEQTGVTAQLKFTKSREKSFEAFVAHAGSLVEKYSHVIIVNLLASNKAYEKNLTDEFQLALNKLPQEYKNKIAYTYFDFHSNCKGQKFHKVNLLVESVLSYLRSYGYYCSSGEVQQGVVRTNCLDCLDRTNVVQSYVAWEILMMFLGKRGLDFKFRKDSGFVKAFNNQWADNADYLSFQYTGTGSTISAVTREGGMSISSLFFQSLTSINRFYNATLQDDIKQESIDSLLRKRSKTQISNRLQEELNKRNKEFIQYFEISIKIVTWNLSGKIIEDFKELCDLQDLHKIVVFGFQQIRNIGECLGDLCSAMAGYKLVSSETSSEDALIVFVEENIAENVEGLRSETVRLQSRGKISKKSAIITMFSVFNSSLLFSSCHLISGTDNNCIRNEQIKQIYNRSLELAGKNNKLEAIFLFGDLNFRVNLNMHKILELIEEGNYEELFKAEQLMQNLKYGYFDEFKEPIITFPPNYPYEEAGEVYDIEKKRGPAWCDRVLYCGNVEPKFYCSVDVSGSSHQPVEAHFTVSAKKINLEMKKRTEELLDEELTASPLGPLPKMLCAKDLIN